MSHPVIQSNAQIVSVVSFQDSTWVSFLEMQEDGKYVSRVEEFRFIVDFETLPNNKRRVMNNVNIVFELRRTLKMLRFDKIGKNHNMTLLNHRKFGILTKINGEKKVNVCTPKIIQFRLLTELPAGISGLQTAKDVEKLNENFLEKAREKLCLAAKSLRVRVHDSDSSDDEGRMCVRVHDSDSSDSEE